MKMKKSTFTFIGVKFEKHDVLSFIPSINNNVNTTNNNINTKKKSVFVYQWTKTLTHMESLQFFVHIFSTVAAPQSWRATKYLEVQVLRYCT